MLFQICEVLEWNELLVHEPIPIEGPSTSTLPLIAWQFILWCGDALSSILSFLIDFPIQPSTIPPKKHVIVQQAFWSQNIVVSKYGGPIRH